MAGKEASLSGVGPFQVMVRGWLASRRAEDGNWVSVGGKCSVQNMQMGKIAMERPGRLCFVNRDYGEGRLKLVGISYRQR